MAGTVNGPHGEQRLVPGAPVQAFKTYRVASPIETHWRPASCAEFECERWRDGWLTICDERTDLGMMQAAWIRSECLTALAPAQAGDPRRRYSESKDEAGRTVFAFPAGQRCFDNGEPHRVKLERPEIYIVRGGDWRGSTGLIRRHDSAEGWVEDFAGHQDRIATIKNRG